MKKVILGTIAVLVIFGSLGAIINEIKESPAANTAPAKPHNAARRLLAKELENGLLRMGFDVQVSVIEEDDSQLMIYGKSVNRPFVHNLMQQRDFRKLLRDRKFTEITFLDSMTFPSFSQAYKLPGDL